MLITSRKAAPPLLVRVIAVIAAVRIAALHTVCSAMLLSAVLVLSFALFLASPLSADETTDKVDKLFAAWDKTTSPGAALAVIRDGRIVYKRGYGMANLEHGLVMTPDRIFDIGSVSKQFTAACIVLLVRDGKVGLDDDVRKHIPELPDYGTPITVRHLLHHTSGLRDYTNLLDLAGFRSDADCPTMAETLEIIHRQKKLNYPPGAEYWYTNTGYFLLGQIVERTSGKSLNAFAQERLFKPLGMEHTFYLDDHTRVIPNRATAYAPAGPGGGYRLDMSNWEQTGDGSVQTSVEDLFLWDRAFYTNALGKDVMDMLHTTGTLASGRKIEYAFGLRVSQFRGLRLVSHSGSWAGYRAAMVRFPDERFTVICLANMGIVNPSGLSYKVADIYLAGRFKEPERKEGAAEGMAAAAAGGAAPGTALPAALPPALPEKDLAPFAGNYQDSKFGLWLSITVKDGRLISTTGGRSYVLFPAGPGRFELRIGSTVETYEFTAAATTQPAKLTVAYSADEISTYVKAAPLVPLTAARLAEYAGTYVSPELLDAKYELLIDKDGLALKTRTLEKGALKPMAPDRFTSSDLEAGIDFVRAKSGKVVGFRLGCDAAAGIEFVKK